MNKEKYFKEEFCPSLIFTKLTGKELDKPQLEIIKTMNRKRFVVVIASRRFGKSYMASLMAVSKMLEGGKKVLVVGPQYKLSGVIWDFVKDIIIDNNFETEKINEKDNIIKLKNKSEFRLGTADNPDSLIGRGFDLIIIDEAAAIDDESFWVHQLRPTLSEKPDSRAIFCTTPRGRANFMYEYFMRGETEEFPEWASLKFTCEDNPRMSQADIEDARKSMGETLFLQEYYCDFTLHEGAVYPSLKDEHLVENLNERGFDGYVSGLDVGFNDPNSMLIVGYKEDEDGQYTYGIIDFFESSEMITSEMAEVIREFEGKYNTEVTWVDNHAKVFINDLVNTYDIYAQPCKKAQKIKDGCGFIDNLIAQGRILFDKEKCQEVFNNMKALTWDPKKALHANPGPKRNNGHIHSCDALRYAVFTHHETYGGSIFTLEDAKKIDD